MERKIYIAGPITGLPNENREAFAEATRQLRSRGYFVVNPHELCACIPSDSPWSAYLRPCIEVLTKSTDIVLIDGWERSKGANLEHMVAVQLELKVYYGLNEFLKKEDLPCSAQSSIS